MTTKNSSQDWLKDLLKDDSNIQLSLDLFDDNMSPTNSASHAALTISAIGIDTIDLGSMNISGTMIGPTGAMGSSYGNITYGSGSAGNGGGYFGGSGGGYYSQPSISISPNTILTSGTNGLTWSDFGNVSPATMQVKGDAEFDGDIKIKGKSLVSTLEKIEEKLAILTPNEKLEEKWDELRELRNRYMQLEKEIIEKEKMWDILKR